METTTRYLISDREFGMMKPTAVLINTCRGPVVDEAALTRALRAGVIKAAGLDVTETEPTPTDNPLLDLDNVVITPHLASMAIESTIDSVKFGVQNAARAARGETARVGGTAGVDKGAGHLQMPGEARIVEDGKGVRYPRTNYETHRPGRRLCFAGTTVTGSRSPIGVGDDGDG